MNPLHSAEFVLVPPLRDSCLRAALGTTAKRSNLTHIHLSEGNFCCYLWLRPVALYLFNEQ